MGLELDDPKYQGRKVRRSEILNEDSDDFDPFQGASEEEAEDAQEESEKSEDNDERLDFETSDEGSYTSENQEDDDEVNDEDEDDFENHDNTEAVNSELARLQKEEESLVKNLSKSSLNDVEKGKAVQAQKVSISALLT